MKPYPLNLILVALAVDSSISFIPNSLLSRQPTPSALFANNDEVNLLDSNVILAVYNEWREKFSKGQFDQVRFQNFENNYKILTTANIQAREKAIAEGRTPPSWMDLNQFGDFSREEYKAVQSGEPTPRAVTTEPLPPPPTTTAVETTSSPIDSSTQYSSTTPTSNYQEQYGQAASSQSSRPDLTVPRKTQLVYGGQRPTLGTQVVIQSASTSGPQVIQQANNPGQPQAGTQVVRTSYEDRGTQVIQKAEDQPPARGTQVLQRAEDQPPVRGTQVIKKAEDPLPMRGTQVIQRSEDAPPVRGTQVIERAEDRPEARGTQVIQKYEDRPPVRGTQVIQRAEDQPPTRGTQVIQRFDSQPPAQGTQVIKRADSQSPNRGTQVIQRAEEQLPPGDTESFSGTRVIRESAPDQIALPAGSNRGTYVIRPTKSDGPKRGTDVISTNEGSVPSGGSGRGTLVISQSEEPTRGTQVIKRSEETGPKLPSTSFFGGSKVTEEPTRSVRGTVVLQRNENDSQEAGSEGRKTILIQKSELEEEAPSFFSFWGGSKNNDQSGKTRATLVLDRNPFASAFSMLTGGSPKSSEEDSDNQS